MSWSVLARAVSTFASVHGRGAVGLRTLCPDLVAMHVWHSVGPADAQRLLCFGQRDLAAGVSSHCELDVFRAQVAAIERDYRIVSLAEALQMLSSGRRGFGWCAVLTFDDGFANTVGAALPWLHDRGLPSTLFVNADLAARAAVKDVDLLIYSLNTVGAARLAAAIQATGIPVQASAIASQAFDFRPLVADPSWPAARRSILETLGTSMSRFASELGIYAPWSELRRLPPSVTVGNHGAAHAFLPALDPEGIGREIEGGLQAIRSELAVADAPYAFAFGQPQDLPAQAAAMANARHTAVLSAFGGINPRGTAPTALRRVPMFSSAHDRLRAEYEFPPRTLLSLAGI